MPTPTRLTRFAAGSALLVALSVGTALPAAAETTDPASDTATETTSVAPLAGDPVTPDPSTTDPGTTDPGTTDPGTTDPGTTDPGTTDPGTTDPGTTDPGTTDPGTTPVDSGTSTPTDDNDAQTSTVSSSSNTKSNSTPRGDRRGAELAETGADTKRTVLGVLSGATLLAGGLTAVFASRVRKPSALDTLA